MRIWLMGTVAFFLLELAACTEVPTQTTNPSQTTTSEGQETESPSGAAAAERGNALVKFINADPDGSGVDIWISWPEDIRMFSNIPFKAITPYTEMPAGEQRFELRERGGKIQGAVRIQYLVFGRHYTVVALPKGDGASRLAIMSDNLGQLEPGRSRVRLINATTDVDDLDLLIAGTESILQHGTDTSMVSSSFTDIVPATLEIRPRNQSTPSQLSNLYVEPGRLYSFVVVGKASALDVVQIETMIDRPT